ncbi:MAG: DUF4886 domain-containing protein [Paraglaciecola sp.]|uniref:DUF4886 domain-containing protein n=1 Tax=Paraglaciecola sp. TaxID=1920173 RepID=UPI003297EE6D
MSHLKYKSVAVIRVSLLVIIAVMSQNLFATVTSNKVKELVDSLVAPEIKPVSKLTRVLFVGNSFSFYNNGIHNHLGSLIRSSGEWNKNQNRLRLSTLSGGYIKEHIADLEYMINVTNRDWQAVVLQGHSKEPINAKSYQKFVEATSIAVQKIKAKDIQPVLFMTWGYKSQARMGRELANVYTQLANKLGVLVVPVGVAFAQAETVLSHIELFVPDVMGVDSKGQLTYKINWKHPSEAGTYLAACVFYATFYQRSPEGLSYTGKLDKEIALALQNLSWKVTQQFYKRNNDAI